MQTEVLQGGGGATPVFVGTTKATSYVATVGFSSVVGNFTETGAAMYTKVMAAGVTEWRRSTAQKVIDRDAWETLPRRVEHRRALCGVHGSGYLRRFRNRRYRPRSPTPPLCAIRSR